MRAIAIARIAAVTTGLLAGACAPAFAQLSPPSLIQVPVPGDVAYDPAHDAYFCVSGKDGVFVDAVTRTPGPRFLIHATPNNVLGIQAVYSPDISDGAGGLGAFVVMWSETLPLSGAGPLQVQIVAYPGRLVGPLRTLESSAREVWSISGAYSPTTRNLLFAWGEMLDTSDDARMVRLDLGAAPVAPIVSLLTGVRHGCFELFYTCNDVTAAWNPVANEFGVLYRDAPTHLLTVARVSTNGTVLERTPVISQNVESSMDVNTATGSYVVVWGAANEVDIEHPSMSVAELSAAGDVLRTGTLSGLAPNTELTAISYSPVSHTFLVIALGVPAELDYRGVQLDTSELSSYYGGFPRIAARTNAPEWGVNPATFLSIFTTRSRSCATPDPFVALGGGVCAGDGWYPPGAGTPPSPPAPPPPPGPIACLTPDPFTAFGGGTCVNGGWFPPGAGAPPPPAPPTPPVPPTPPIGCVTPDPFVAFGGGVCFNGGWYFRS